MAADSRSRDRAGLSLDGLDHLKRWLDAIAARPGAQRGIEVPPSAEQPADLASEGRNLLV